MRNGDRNVYLGIDIGSSSVRTAVFGEDGQLLSLFGKQVALLSPEPGAAELDPDAVFCALIETLAECAARYRHIAGAGFDAIMHTLLPVDEAGKPLCHALTWGDTRAQAQADRLAADPDCGRLSRATGCHLASPIYPAAKAMWLKETRPDLWRRCAGLWTLKQYIQTKLFGQAPVDWSDAASTGFFDIGSKTWNAEVLAKTGVSAGLLGQATPPDTLLPPLLPRWREATGLPEGIPFCLGATDGVAANLGCGVFDDTRLSSTVGTTGAIRICLPGPPAYAGEELWCYSFLPGVFVTGAAVSNGGIALSHLKKILGLSYAEMDAQAQRIPLGCEGLTFLPTFLGERSPDYNARTTGALHGMRLDHGAGHLARAAMEGVMYRLYDNYLCVREAAPHVELILANGGYAKSETWMRIQADIFQREIAAAGAVEAAALGAAYLGMMAAGRIAYGEHLPAMKPGRRISPAPGTEAAAREGYARYRELYRKLYGGNP